MLKEPRRNHFSMQMFRARLRLPKDSKPVGRYAASEEKLSFIRLPVEKIRIRDRTILEVWKLLV